MPPERFTIDGSDELEHYLREMLAQATSRLCTTIGTDAIRTILLMGGYGRGEGGVKRTPAGDRPHNNLDILVILRRRISLAARKNADHALGSIRDALGVGIDIGFVRDTTLRLAKSRVMWVDMRSDHRHLFGDRLFVPSLRNLEAEAIDDNDIEDLLVNRAALFVLNTSLQGLQKTHRIKHTVKGIMGVGDTALLRSGAYDSHYRIRAELIAQQPHVPKDFVDLYQACSRFRLRPNLDEHANIEVLLETALPIVRRTHAQIVARAGGPPNFDGHAAWTIRRRIRPQTLPHVLRSRMADVLRRRVQALHRMSLMIRRLRAAGWSAHLCTLAAAASDAEISAAVLPTVLYGTVSAQENAVAAALLGTRDARTQTLRKAFARRWGFSADANFAHVVRAHPLDETQSDVPPFSETHHHVAA